MKKIVKISAVLFAIAFAFSCSNNAGGGAGSGGSESGGTESGGGNTPSIPSGPEFIEFGTWPQTIKAPDVTVNEITTRKMIAGMFTYYEGSDGNWYCKVRENAYGVQDYYEYSDGTKISASHLNSYKWFKMEPIKWRVLTDNYGGKKLIFCESGIYAGVMFYDHENATRNIDTNVIQPNNYEHSRIRAWLNGLEFQLGNDTNSDHLNKGFLQTAFTDAERVKIADTVVDNSVASTGYKTNKYACKNTTDKIFLLSYKEVTDPGYGFTDKNSCIRKQTDFALANYAYKDNNGSYGGKFFLRSPFDSNSDFVLYVNSDGDNMWMRGNIGSNIIVPALCIAP